MHNVFIRKGQIMGTLRSEMVDYMKTRGYSVKTISLYTTCVNVFARYFNKSPLLIRYEEIESFFLYLRDQNKSESTIHIYYESLKYFYTMHNLKNQLPKISFHRLNSKLPVILSQKEVFDLLSNCSSLKYRTLFTLIYSAGLRISEASNLKLSDIDFIRKQLFIRAGKNKKDRYTILGEKTIEILKGYLNVFNPTEYIFYSKKDISNKISIDSIHREFNKLVLKSNIEKKIHVHTLRHCFATHLLEHGTSIFYIMQLLGHSCIQTTLIYLHMQEPYKLNINSPIDLYENSITNSDMNFKNELLLESA